MLEILNLLVAALGGVFLLSILGETDTRALIQHATCESQPEPLPRSRTLEDFRMVRSSKTEDGGFVA